MNAKNDHDPINNPPHYEAKPAAVRCIDITRHLPSDLGCAFQYVWRAGIKNPETFKEDLRKAIFYLEDHKDNFEGDIIKHDVALAIFKLIVIVPASMSRTECWRIGALRSMLDGNLTRAMSYIGRMVGQEDEN